MATKRTFVAWSAIVLLGFDITAEIARLGVCIVKPDPRDAALCADPIGPVSRMVAQMFRLLSETPAPEPPPVVPAPPEPPPVAPVSPLDRIKAAGKL